MPLNEADVRAVLAKLVDPNTGKEAYKKAINKAKFEEFKDAG